MRLSRYNWLMALLLCCCILFSAVVLAQADDLAAEPSQEYDIYELAPTADDYFDDFAVANAFLDESATHDASPAANTAASADSGEKSLLPPPPPNPIIDGFFGKGNFDQWFDNAYDADVSITSNTALPSTPCEVVVKCPSSKLTVSLETIIVGIKLTGYTLQSSKSLQLRLTSDGSNKVLLPFTTSLISDGGQGEIFVLAFFSRIEIGTIALDGVNVTVAGLISPKADHPKFPGCAAGGYSNPGQYTLCKVAYKLFILRASLSNFPKLGQLTVSVICTSNTATFKCSIPCGPTTPPPGCPTTCSYENLPNLQGDALVKCCAANNFLHFDPDYCCVGKTIDNALASRCNDDCHIHKGDDGDIQNRYKKCCSKIGEDADPWKLRQCCDFSGVTKDTLYCCAKQSIFDDLCTGDQKDCCTLTPAKDRPDDCCDPDSEVFKSLFATDPDWIKQNCCASSVGWPALYSQLCEPICIPKNFDYKNLKHVKACCSENDYHEELCCKYKGANIVPYLHDKCCKVEEPSWINTKYCCKASTYHPDICCKPESDDFIKDKCCEMATSGTSPYTGDIILPPGDKDDRCTPRCIKEIPHEFPPSCCATINQNNQDDCCSDDWAFTVAGCCQQNTRGEISEFNWKGVKDPRCKPNCADGPNYQATRCCNDETTFNYKYCCNLDDVKVEARHKQCCREDEYWEVNANDCCKVDNGHTPHVSEGSALKQCCGKNDGFTLANPDLCCTGASKECCANPKFFAAGNDEIKAQCCQLGSLPAGSNTEATCCKYPSYFDANTQAKCCAASQFPPNQQGECCVIPAYFNAGDNEKKCCAIDKYPTDADQKECCEIPTYFDTHVPQCCDLKNPAAQCCKDSVIYSKLDDSGKKTCCLLGALPKDVPVTQCCAYSEYFNENKNKKQCCTAKPPAFPPTTPTACCVFPDFYDDNLPVCCDKKKPCVQCCKNEQFYTSLDDAGRKICCTLNALPPGVPATACCIDTTYFNNGDNKKKCCTATPSPLFPSNDPDACCDIPSFYTRNHPVCCNLLKPNAECCKDPGFFKDISNDAQAYCCAQNTLPTGVSATKCCEFSSYFNKGDNKKVCCRANPPASPPGQEAACCPYITGHNPVCCDKAKPTADCCKNADFYNSLTAPQKQQCCELSALPAGTPVTECCANVKYFTADPSRCCVAGAANIPAGKEATCCAYSAYWGSVKDKCCELKTLPSNDAALKEEAHKYCCITNSNFFNDNSLQLQCCLHDHIPTPTNDNLKKCCKRSEYFSDNTTTDNDRDTCCRLKSLPSLPGSKTEFDPRALKFCCTDPRFDDDKQFKCPCECKDGGCPEVHTIRILKDQSGKIDAKVTLNENSEDINPKDGQLLLDLIRAKLNNLQTVPDQLTIELKGDTFYVLGAENLRDDAVKVHDDEF